MLDELRNLQNDIKQGQKLFSIFEKVSAASEILLGSESRLTELHNLIASNEEELARIEALRNEAQADIIKAQFEANTILSDARAEAELAVQKQLDAKAQELAALETKISDSTMELANRTMDIESAMNTLSEINTNIESRKDVIDDLDKKLQATKDKLAKMIAG